MMSVHDIVRQDDIQSLKSWIATGHDVNVISGDLQNTALHLAASQGHLEASQLLLHAGANCKLKNKKGSYPVHSAVTYNHPKVLELLLSHDKSMINLLDKFGNSLVHIAVLKRHPEILEYLLKKDISMAGKNNEGNTVFHMAVMWNRPFILKMLLRHSNKQVNDTNINGYTSLHLAALKDYDECVQCLLMNGANPLLKDKAGKLAGQFGSEYTRNLFVKFELLKKIKTGCVNGMASIIGMRKYRDDLSALHIAATFDDCRQVIHQLVLNGAVVNSRDAHNRTPLWYALQSGCIHNIRALIMGGGQCEELKKNNFVSPLHVAIQRHDLELAELFLHNKVNPNVCDMNGETPLFYAVVNHCREGVHLLIKYGANVSLKDQHSNTPLHVSATANNIDITEDLLKIDSTLINDFNSYKHTPLMCAILGRNAELTKLLLNNGANLDSEDCAGKSAHSLILASGHKPLINSVTTYLQGVKT